MFNLWAFMLNKDTNYHELTMNFAVLKINMNCH